ncbi:MAG: phosphonate ABC transporter ATP-binding protein [Chthonomonadales bacterium]
MAPDLADPVVELTDITHFYRGERPAIDRVSLTIRPGERLGLVGMSGAGKSTLLRTINGLVLPTTGNVRVLGQNVRSLPERDLRILRTQIGMIFQEFALIERLDVLTNVLVGRLGRAALLPSLARIFPHRDVELARSALAEVGLAGYEQRIVRQLSGGQKQRVGIARALVQEPSLILADEPTANLDVRTSEEILRLIAAVADQRHAAVILSLHDVRAARRICTRILALQEGRIVWEGEAAAFTDSVVDRVFYDTGQGENGSLQTIPPSA